MFFTTFDNTTTMNVNLIESIVALDKTQVNSVKSIFTLQELADFGFKVGRRDEFVKTASHDEARRAVAESPDTRVFSSGVPGYVQLQSGETGLIRQFFTISKDGNGEKHEDELFFLPKSQYKETIAYMVTMRGGDQFYIKTDDYEKLKKLIDAIA